MYIYDMFAAHQKRWSDEERNAEYRYYRNARSTQDGIEVITEEFQEKQRKCSKQIYARNIKLLLMFRF